MKSLYDLDRITNLSTLLENQQKKMQDLRDIVKKLKFIPLDPGGSYQSVTFKAFDGGMFSLNFDPFEFDIVAVADSNGKKNLEFAAPSGDLGDNSELRNIIGPFEEKPVIHDFLTLLGRPSLLDITEVLTRRETLMEIGEFACMFDKIRTAPADEQTIVMRDGLLRTKKIKAELNTKTEAKPACQQESC